MRVAHRNVDLSATLLHTRVLFNVLHRLQRPRGSVLVSVIPAEIGPVAGVPDDDRSVAGAVERCGVPVVQHGRGKPNRVIASRERRRARPVGEHFVHANPAARRPGLRSAGSDLGPHASSAGRRGRWRGGRVD
jgi:hypothetical protein